MQKIMYFIKESGKGIHEFDFIKDKFGRYSDGLRRAIQQLEGYYIRGTDDGTQMSEISLVESAIEASRDFLSNREDATEHLEKSAFRCHPPKKALEVLVTKQIWVNRDCELKKRNWDDAKRSLNSILEAADYLRPQLPHLKDTRTSYNDSQVATILLLDGTAKVVPKSS